MAVTIQASPFVSSFNGTLPWTQASYSVTLGASSAKTVTVPGDNSKKYRANFEFNVTSNIFVGYNITAAVPSSGTAVSTPNQEFIPKEARYVVGGDVLSFITPDTAAYFSVSFIAIPNN